MDKKFQKSLVSMIDEAVLAKLQAIAVAFDLDFAEVKKVADSVSDIKKSPKGRKTKKDVDPNAPKKPMTAFFMFSSSKTEEIIAEVKKNPNKKYKDKNGNTFKVKEENYGKDGVTLQRPIISKSAGYLWAELGVDGRKEWKVKSDGLKEKYEKELQAYNKANGVQEKSVKKSKKKIKTPSIVEDSDEEEKLDVVEDSSSDE